MEQQLTQPKETEGKGRFFRLVRTGLLFLGVVVLVLTFFMAIYRKIGG